jgi:hypothetical protein
MLHVYLIHSQMCLTWNACEFHVKRASNVNSHESFSYELHVNFTWTSLEFHVKFMWSYQHSFHVQFTPISCEVYIEFTWNLHEIHTKFTWNSHEIHVDLIVFSYLASNIQSWWSWKEGNYVLNLMVIYWLDFSSTPWGSRLEWIPHIPSCVVRGD